MACETIGIDDDLYRTLSSYRLRMLLRPAELFHQRQNRGFEIGVALLTGGDACSG